MTLFVAASALVAIIHEEPESAALRLALTRAAARITSGIALWEASRALARLTEDSQLEGLLEAERYCASLDIQIAPIAAAEATEAVRAQMRYGKGTGHPARLNMGDCFAYACARTNNARLLYKGDDFIHTDLA